MQELVLLNLLDNEVPLMLGLHKRIRPDLLLVLIILVVFVVHLLALRELESVPQRKLLEVVPRQILQNHV